MRRLQRLMSRNTRRHGHGSLHRKWGVCEWPDCSRSRHGFRCCWRPIKHRCDGGEVSCGGHPQVRSLRMQRHGADARVRLGSPDRLFGQHHGAAHASDAGVFTGRAQEMLTNQVQPDFGKVCAAGATVTTANVQNIVNAKLPVLRTIVDRIDRRTYTANLRRGRVLVLLHKAASGLRGSCWSIVRNSSFLRSASTRRSAPSRSWVLLMLRSAGLHAVVATAAAFSDTGHVSGRIVEIRLRSRHPFPSAWSRVRHRTDFDALGGQNSCAKSDAKA
jgi:hypothetical protein